MRQRYQPVPLSQARVNLRRIPKGYLGTRKTLEHIQALVRQGAKDFYVRQKAIDILLQRGVRPKDYLGEIQALFEWVQQNVRYTRDPYRVEVLHSARRLLELRAGDCDDMTILLAAMLEAVGHPTRLVIVGPTPLKPDLFSHIYLEANHRGRWIALDPTMPFSIGWAPKTFVKKIISIDRRNPMMSGDMELQGTESVGTAADWLSGLARAVAGAAVPPRDPRVKKLYDLLVQRKIWKRSPRIRKVLRFAWKRGLAARPRPRLGKWFSQRLARWGLMTGQAAPTGPQPVPSPSVRRPFKRVGLRPVRVSRVQPVQVAVAPQAPARR